MGRKRSKKRIGRFVGGYREGKNFQENGKKE